MASDKDGTKKKKRNIFKSQEWEFPPEGETWSRQQRIEYLMHLVRTIGLFNVNKKDLAKKMNVSRAQLYRDLESLYKQGLDKDYVDRAKIESAGLIEMAKKEMTKIMLKGTPKERARAAKVLKDYIQEEREMMESFGIKKPNQTSTTPNIVLKWGKKTEEDEED